MFSFLVFSLKLNGPFACANGPFSFKEKTRKLSERKNDVFDMIGAN